MALKITLNSNTKGRDFVIGDLHGCYDQLKEKMNEVDFDKSKDRLFSVGDLIDRGPDPIKCIELIYEPWFFATQGNHERMFFSYILGDRSIYHQPSDFIRNGGHWIHDVEITSQFLKILAEDMKEKMPLVYEVRGQDGFIVTHSRLMSEEIELIENGRNFVLEKNDLSTNPDDFVWDRSIVTMMSYMMTDNRYREQTHSLIKLTDFDPEEKLVYVGHNTLKNMNNIFLLNHLMIDTGAYAKSVPIIGSTEKSLFGLTMVEHKKMLNELKGH